MSRVADRTTSLAIALAAGLLAAATSGSQAQEPKKSSIVIPVSSTRQLPVFIADERGFWKESGLDVKVSVVAGVAATNAVLSKSVDFAYTGSLAMQRVVAQGQQLVAIAMMQRGLSHQIVLRGDIGEKLAAANDVAAKAKALAGLTIAVDTLDGQPHGYLKYMLGRNGLDPDRAVTVTPVQPPAMVGALNAKAVEGIVFSKPWTDLAVSQAKGRLWLASETDSPELQPFAAAVVVARPDLCKASPDTCRGIVAGLDKAVRWIRANPGEAEKFLQKKFERMDARDNGGGLCRTPSYSNGDNLEPFAGDIRGRSKVPDRLRLLPKDKAPPIAGLFTDDSSEVTRGGGRHGRAYPERATSAACLGPRTSCRCSSRRIAARRWTKARLDGLVAAAVDESVARQITSLRRHRLG